MRDGGSDLRSRLDAVMATVRAPGPGPFWVYGAGGFGRTLASRLRDLGHPVRGFVDRSAPSRPEVDGLPCIEPSAFDPAATREATLVYGIMNWATSPAGVLEWADEIGFGTVAFAADLQQLPDFRFQQYWCEPAMRTLSRTAEIERMLGLLDDDASRDLVEQLLIYRLTTDPRRHPATRSDDLYAPDFLPIFDRPIRFVDGGAFTGDSIRPLLDKGLQIESWIAFEPDAGNFDALDRTAADVRRSIGEIRLFRAGLSDRTGKARFASGTGASSHIAEVSEPACDTVEIETSRLDDVLAPSMPTYVKLDIEGAEQDALRGMPALLAARPTLAVSLYHRAADLWEIPNLLAELYDRPRMRIRQHHHHGFETVLYVWPR